MECNAGAPSNRKRQLYFVEPNFPVRTSAGSRSVLRFELWRRAGRLQFPARRRAHHPNAGKNVGVAIGMERQLASIALRPKRMGSGHKPALPIGIGYPQANLVFRCDDRVRSRKVLARDYKSKRHLNHDVSGLGLGHPGGRASTTAPKETRKRVITLKLFSRSRHCYSDLTVHWNRTEPTSWGKLPRRLWRAFTGGNCFAAGPHWTYRFLRYLFFLGLVFRRR
jgi:hypothetical protein